MTLKKVKITAAKATFEIPINNPFGEISKYLNAPKKIMIEIPNFVRIKSVSKACIFRSNSSFLTSFIVKKKLKHTTVHPNKTAGTRSSCKIDVPRTNKILTINSKFLKKCACFSGVDNFFNNLSSVLVSPKIFEIIKSIVI